VFVKICGITHPADARAAVDAGADAIGLNFVPTSRRYVDLDTARAIVAVTPGHIMTVGVFRNHPVAEILAITDGLGLSAAQLHGDEPPDVTHAVAASVATVIKVFAPDHPAIHTLVDEHAADIVMLDAPTPGGGVAFNWDLVGNLVTRHKVLLAGGLRPDNVADAVRLVRPWGVDVATGVEASSGRKDPDALALLVTNARRTPPALTSTSSDLHETRREHTSADDHQRTQTGSHAGGRRPLVLYGCCTGARERRRPRPGDRA
jgi:phosphoribosylanthranilate isomerase